MKPVKPTKKMIECEALLRKEWPTVEMVVRPECIDVWLDAPDVIAVNVSWVRRKTGHWHASVPHSAATTATTSTTTARGSDIDDPVVAVKVALRRLADAAEVSAGALATKVKRIVAGETVDAEGEK